MRAPSIAYAVLLASSLATTSQLTGRQRLHQPCGPCLATDDYLLPTIQAPHAALRFVYRGQWVAPKVPFAAYDSLTDANTQIGFQQQDQLRFGAVYLVKGTCQPMTAGYLRSAICVQGPDTMQVYVQPDHKYPYWVYDSIPFRPGRYELMSPQSSRYSLAFTPHQLNRVGLATVSFATYYRQHRAELDWTGPIPLPTARSAATSRANTPRRPTGTCPAILWISSTCCSAIAPTSNVEASICAP